MRWGNSILYLGIICIIAGILLAIFAETNRYQYIAGVSTSTGLIISALGSALYKKKYTLSD